MFFDNFKFLILKYKLFSIIEITQNEEDYYQFVVSVYS